MPCGTRPAAGRTTARVQQVERGGRKWEGTWRVAGTEAQPQQSTARLPGKRTWGGDADGAAPSVARRRIGPGTPLGRCEEGGCWATGQHPPLWRPLSHPLKVIGPVSWGPLQEATCSTQDRPSACRPAGWGAKSVAVSTRLTAAVRRRPQRPGNHTLLQRPRLDTCVGGGSLAVWCPFSCLPKNLQVVRQYLTQTSKI